MAVECKLQTVMRAASHPRFKKQLGSAITPTPLQPHPWGCARTEICTRVIYFVGRLAVPGKLIGTVFAI